MNRKGSRKGSFRRDWYIPLGHGLNRNKADLYLSINHPNRKGKELEFFHVVKLKLRLGVLI